MRRTENVGIFNSLLVPVWFFIFYQKRTMATALSRLALDCPSRRTYITSPSSFQMPTTTATHIFFSAFTTTTKHNVCLHIHIRRALRSRGPAPNARAHPHTFDLLHCYGAHGRRLRVHIRRHTLRREPARRLAAPEPRGRAPAVRRGRGDPAPRLHARRAGAGDARDVPVQVRVPCVFPLPLSPSSLC